MYGCILRGAGLIGILIFIISLIAITVYYIIENQGLKAGWEDFIYDLHYDYNESRIWLSIIIAIFTIGMIMFCNTFSLKHAEFESTAYADLLAQDCKDGYNNELTRVVTIDGVEYTLPPSKGRKEYLGHLEKFKYWTQRTNDIR